MPSIDVECYFESSFFSWGAYFGHHKIGGTLDTDGKKLHINSKELLTLYYSLRSFKDHFIDKYEKTFSDSQTGIMIISKTGTSKNSQNNLLVKVFWLFCSSNNVWLTSTHITDAKNTFLAVNEEKFTNMENGC